MPAESNISLNRREAILAGETVQTAETKQIDDAQAEALKGFVSQIIGDYVKSKTGKAAVGQIELNMSDRQLAQLATATAAPTCNGGSEPWTGRQKFTLSFTTPNGAVQLPVNADVPAPAMPAVVATRTVARGSVVTAADVELRMIDPTAKTTGQRAIIDTMGNIIGKEARQPLQVGEIVFADEVQSPIVVKRGDLITVGSQSGGIRVRTSARALQDGATGDLIQVESLESKERYDARVVGMRQASVFAPARASTPQKPERVQSARRPFSPPK